MAGKTVRESASKFIKRLMKTEDEKEAREKLEQSLAGGLQAIGMIQTTGSLTLVINPGGLHSFSATPYFTSSLKGLEFIEKAINEFREVILTELRTDLVDAEAEKKAEEIIKSKGAQDTEESQQEE